MSAQVFVRSGQLSQPLPIRGQPGVGTVGFQDYQDKHGTRLRRHRVSHQGLNKQTCHPDMSELRADISSAATKIFAASVALNELLHLGYVTSELGLSYPQPIMLEVDNATAIIFSKDQVRRSKLCQIDCRQAWVEVLHDEHIVKLIKVDTNENLADLNSKLCNVVRFEYLMNKTMVCKELLTQTKGSGNKLSRPSARARALRAH